MFKNKNIAITVADLKVVILMCGKVGSEDYKDLL